MRNISFRQWKLLTAIAAIAAMTLLPGSLAAQDELEKPPPIPPGDSEDVPIPPKIQDEQIVPTVTIREE